jgi:hypothetical protein
VTLVAHEVMPAAIAAARTWLLAARDPHGWWCDFRLAPGRSDEWVTAYVGSILADGQDRESRAAARQAGELLQRRPAGHGGWGYNGLTPCDADSTAWALRLARTLGEDRSPRARAGHRFLVRHERTDGGVATYAEDTEIRAFTGLPATIPFTGWCASHVCVTAAAAELREYGQLLPFLRARQEPTGGWRAYWWADPEYAAALAVAALVASDDPDDRARVSRACEWAADRMDRPPLAGIADEPASAFVTAWCLEIFTLADDAARWRDARANAVSRLLEQQRPDGSWEPSARMRVPHPDTADPDLCDDWEVGGRIDGALIVDDNAVFTTATVLHALRAHQASPAGDGGHP